MTVSRVIEAKQAWEKVFKLKPRVVTMHPDAFNDCMIEVELKDWRKLEVRPKLCGLPVELDTGFPPDQVVVS
jgi:hypothetical protein